MEVSRDTGGEKRSITFWIDTAFNGGLVVPRAQIDDLGLREASSTPATLADGSTVDLPTYSCHIEWFGNEYRTQVVANDGAFPLLGTMLLTGRNPEIGYGHKGVKLE